MDPSNSRCRYFTKKILVLVILSSLFTLTMMTSQASTFSVDSNRVEKGALLNRPRRGVVHEDKFSWNKMSENDIMDDKIKTIKSTTEPMRFNRHKLSSHHGKRVKKVLNGRDYWSMQNVDNYPNTQNTRNIRTHRSENE